jgi:hypothetical protein
LLLQRARFGDEPVDCGRVTSIARVRSSSAHAGSATTAPTTPFASYSGMPRRSSGSPTGGCEAWGSPTNSASSVPRRSTSRPSPWVWAVAR